MDFFVRNTRMPISKTKKKEVIKELSDKLARQKALVFADFTGLKVKDLSELKKKLKAGNSEFKVAKKTLMAVAFKDSHIEVEPKTLDGEIALVMGYEDQVVPAKTLYEFSKTNQNIKILGGYMENQPLTIAQVLELAKLPSKTELLGRLVGSMSSPARNFAYVLQANIAGLVTVLSKIKKEEAAA